MHSFFEAPCAQVYAARGGEPPVCSPLTTLHRHPPGMQRDNKHRRANDESAFAPLDKTKEKLEQPPAQKTHSMWAPPMRASVRRLR